MPYPNLIYDFADQSFRISVMLIPVSLVLLGLVLFFAFRRDAHRLVANSKPTTRSILGMIGSVIFTAIAATFTIIVGVLHIKTYHQCHEAYYGQQYTVVEGPVEEYQPMSAHGHGQESFVVRGIRFAFSDYDVSHYGYNTSAAHGGAIRSGLHVNIWYVPYGRTNVILRLATE